MKIQPIVRVLAFLLLIESLLAAAQQFEESAGYTPATPAEEFQPGFEDALRNAGIDPVLASNCGFCTYDESTGVITLAAGANVNIQTTEISSGTVIDLNGGILLIPGGTVSGEGIYIAGQPPQLDHGILELNSARKMTTLHFKDSLIVLESGGEIQGHGRIEQGIIIIDEADVSSGGVVEHIRNAKVESLRNEVILLRGGNDFKMGSGRNIVQIGELDGDKVREMILFQGTRGETVLIAGRVFRDYDDLIGERGDPAVIEVQGNPTFSIGFHPFFKEDPPQPLTLKLKGQEHLILGNPFIKEGQVIFPKETLVLESPQMIDGIYLVPRTDVYVHFDDEPHTGENYIVLGDQLRMGGDDFAVLLGEAGVGCPAVEYCHAFIGNKYTLKKKEYKSPFRFIVNFDGKTRQVQTEESVSEPAESQYGEVVIDPRKKRVTSKGTLQLVNGVNTIDYFVEDGKQKYNFAPIACGGNNEKSCTPLDYDLIDSGKINIPKGIGLPPVRQGTEKVYLRNYGDSKQEAEVILDKSSVYVMGYKGGEFSEGFLGKEDKKSGWGHVGLLHCAPATNGCVWTVTEADGRRVTRAPIAASLFEKNLDGIWRVNDYEGNPAQSGEVEAQSRRIAGAPYAKFSLSGSQFSCVSAVESCLEAAGAPLAYPSTVSFTSINPARMNLKAKLYQVTYDLGLQTITIPDMVVQSQNLESIKVTLQQPLNPDLVDLNQVALGPQ